MKLFVVAISLYLSCIGNISAQAPDLDNKEVLMKLLEMKSVPFGPEAKAVTIYEKGTVGIYNNSSKYQLERVVKILHGDATTELGAILIPRIEGMAVRKLRAVVYNYEDGIIISSDLERDNLIQEKVTDDIRVTKVYLPNIKKGSVLHYQYTLENDNIGLLKTEWDFQGDYPCMHSEYEANLPGYLVYDAVIRINVADVVHAKTKKQLEKGEAAIFRGATTTQDAMATNIWIRRNIPAIKEDNYMSSIDNYRERVRLHLKSIYYHGYSQNLNLKWDEICRKRYYENENFIKPVFRNNNFLNIKVTQLTTGISAQLDQAKAIYNFIRDSTERFEGPKNTFVVRLKQILEQKSGTAMELNLLMVAMLRVAGIDAVPVLLSTRNNERLNEYFPDPDNIDYLVGMIKIDTDTFYVDGSEKILPFGVLPSYCYNGYSRIISEKGGAIYLESEQLKDNSVIMVNTTQSEDGKQKHEKVDVKLGWISSFEFRKKWQLDSLEFKKHLLNKLPENAALTGYSCNTMQDLNERLSFSYEITSTVNGADIIYFDPFPEKFFDENPFPAQDRYFPIELPYLRDIRIISSFKMGKNYQPEADMLQSKAILLNPAGDLKFISNIEYKEASNELKIYSRYEEHKSYIPSNFYADLRLFYEKIIAEQNQKIVIRKM